MPEIVVMITTSYPRFPGDTVGTFMEPIAHGVAARGHEVHVVLPWHPKLRRPEREGRVHFHPFRYAPHPSMNIFGYAEALRADVNLRWKAFAAAPLALAAGWWTARRVAARVGATMMHGHWVIPGGAIGATATRGLPLVISLHGSDVYVAERHAIAGRVAGHAFARAGWVTACSADLRSRALRLGADEQRSDVVPYGVDADRFRPDAAVRAEVRASLGIGETTPMVFAAGRFVRKKGFEYLIDAIARLAARESSGAAASSASPASSASSSRDADSRVMLVMGGDGDLRDEFVARARDAGITERVRFVGLLSQDAVARHFAAADVIAAPSVRDDSGNVDGLPNVVLEALASATPLVATPAGGIASAVDHDRTGVLVPERDPDALAAAIASLLESPSRRRMLGDAARADVIERFGWARAAERFEHAYIAARAHHANRAHSRA
jgi:glycosyltransferase involved in cell wall biosynthesis